jgi:hypothetical protein
MMKIHHRCKREETRYEIGMKYAADDPWPRNEQRNASGDQRHYVSRNFPIRLFGSAGFSFLVVTGDPQILRGMQYCQQAAAVPRLRNFLAASEFNRYRKEKPEKLRDRQRERRNDLA